jgi:alpha-2-macroglobulin-like protein
VSAGDVVRLPVSLTNETNKAVDVDVSGSFGPLLTAKGNVGSTSSLGAAGASTAKNSRFIEMTVTGISGVSPVVLSAAGSGLKDEIKKEIVVTPRGFPAEQSFSGSVKLKESFAVQIDNAMPGTIEGSVRFYASPTATLVSGLEGMLREPSGCFEQTSSTNYPNVMIMNYLQKNNVAAPELTQRAEKLIKSGYQKLTAFETKEKGYEWFGGAPGHEALTAYGLLEFQDMKGVYGGVDDAMIARTAAWLKARRDGKGGYTRNDRALDSFGGASPEVTNAYITYALSEAQMTSDLQKEIDAVASSATSSNDAYVLALAVNTLANANKMSEAKSASKRLASMQDKDGSWKKAQHSITRSGGQNLLIETTSLAVMGLLKTGEMEPVRKGIEWLYANRSGYGQWGATQATVLALQAFIRYVEATRATQNSGNVVVQINGKTVKNVAYEAGRKDPIVVDGLGSFFKDGKNDVTLLIDGKDSLPYSMVVSHRTKAPKTSDKTAVALTVTADKTAMKMGETMRITATVKNTTDVGQPMTIARIGIPGGTTFVLPQLKKLKEDGIVDAWETRPREVIVYYRALAPNAEKVVNINVTAVVPGSYEAPASSGYLYYTDEFKSWAAPVSVTIEP